MPRICDYEGSRYRTEFWEGQNRAYEDRVERLAMQKMLPPTGSRLIEVGAGFGRLADLYGGYKQVVLMDYALSQLQEARRYLGQDPRFVYVAADVYHLPFVDHLFDTLTMVRVMHHLADVPGALAELHRIISPGGTAIIEHASKFHLKALLRWLLGRQQWNPFDQAPLEFVELNFDFHPAWMRRQLAAAGFQLQNTRTLSHYRLQVLKRLLPTGWLVRLDGWAQPTGNWWQLTPSLFLQAQAQKATPGPAEGFFRCLACGSPHLPPPEPAPTIDYIACPGCGHHWPVEQGIYNFKPPDTI